MHERHSGVGHSDCYWTQRAWRNNLRYGGVDLPVGTSLGAQRVASVGQGGHLSGKQTNSILKRIPTGYHLSR